MRPEPKATSSVRYDQLNNYPQEAPLTTVTSLEKRKWSWVSNTWFWEIAAIIASAGCMAAVIAILGSLQSRPLSQWMFPISLNATIAIFITAAKSMTLLVIASCIAQSKWIKFKSSARELRELDLYEEASRGPLGSLLLLSHVRWRTGLATLGAIATILALGVDAFAQQVVHFPIRDVEFQDGVASFGLSRFYNGSAHFLDQNDSNMKADDSTADRAMQGAVYSGIFNTTPTHQFNCPSRCAWKDSYISLGFYSSCTNVTEPTLKSNSTPVPDTGLPVYRNMTTPGNISLSVDFMPTSWQMNMGIFANSLVPDKRLDGPFPAEFARIAVVRTWLDYTAYGSINASVYFNTLEVIECNVGLTAYKYSNASASGTAFNITPEAIALDSATYAPSGYNDTWLTDKLVFNQTGLPVLQAMTADITALISLFQSSRFSGKIYVGEEPPEPSTGMGLALRTGNISMAFDNMASSMTEQLRSSYDDTAKGVTIRDVTFVQVQWVWLALPLAILLTAAVLLAGTMFSSRSHQVKLWKSSAVAMLYHEIAFDAGGSKGVLRSDVKSLDHLDALAKKTKVRLE